MEISTRKEDNAMILTVSGRLDAFTSADFEKALAELMDQGNRNFVLDFAELYYISSTGIRSILAAVKKLNGMHGKFTIACLRKMVKEVFDISGFSTIIPIFDSVASALEAM